MKLRFGQMLFLSAPAILAQTTAGISASSASIHGTVIDAKTLKPIPAAVITASRSAPPSSAKRTRSGGDGSFAIQGLTAGAYSLCVQVQGDRYLDPCSWGGAPSPVTLAAGQAVSSVSLHLVPSSTLSVTLADSQGLLTQATVDGRAPELKVGVWGQHGVYYPAHLAGGQPVAPRLAAGAVPSRTYVLAVPFDTALQFYIASRDLKIGDATGAALPANAALQAFQHVTGASNPTSFAFSILGKQP